jgi:putative ABC transport system permease protein
MDFAYSVRTLIRNPVFTAAVVVMLAIGIGASAAIFGVIDRLFIRPLPFKDQDQLVSLEKAWPLFYKAPEEGEYAAQPDDAFAGVAQFEMGRVTLGSQIAAPEVIRLVRTSRDFFPVLGVGPQAGYFFSRAERSAQGDNVAVLSNGVWRRVFNQDRAIVGRQITLNGRSFTVLGVMPPEFLFLVRGREADAWIPLVSDDSLVNTEQGEGRGVIARLKPGLTLDQAQARTDVVFQRLAETQPQLKLKPKNRILLTQLRDHWFGNLRFPLLMLLGTGICLLLIAGANTMSLMIARSAERQKDMAIRVALGAGRFQMIRQHLLESLLLAIAGSVLGLLIAFWATKSMLALSPTPIPNPDDVGLNFRIIAFAFAISIPAAIIPGWIAAWKVSRTSVRSILNEGSARTTSLLSPRLRKVLVVAEVALTVLVLINAGLLFRSFRGLLQEKIGFDTENVLTLEVAPLTNKYPDAQKRGVLYQRIIDQVKSLPAVTNVGTVNYLPIFSGSLLLPVELQERVIPAEHGLSWTYRVASSDYFNTMRIPIVEGRTFSEHDTVDAPRVVVLDQAAAVELQKDYFPNETVLGKHIILNFDKPTSFEIIGIAGDIRQQGLDIKINPGFYLHALQRPPAVANLVVRTTSDPVSIAGALRNTIAEVDKDLPVSDLRLLEKQVSDSVSRRRFGLLLTSILGTGALLLSMLGLYSLMSHIVLHRTREIGVRMALGANVWDVLKLVLRQALILVIIGIALGIAISFATGRLVASLLFGVTATDQITFAVVAVILVIVALVACYIPARRAMKVDPIEALRYE